MTQDRAPADMIDLLREMFRNEWKHVNRRLDEQAIEMGKLRAENKSDHQELRRDFGGLRTDVNKALAGVGALTTRMDVHDKHHGDNDSAIKARIEGLEDADHDEAVRTSRDKWWLAGIFGAFGFGAGAIELAQKLGVI